MEEESGGADHDERRALPVLWGFLLAFPVAAVLGAAVLGQGRPPPDRTRQPIAFNHKKHVEEAGIECSTCHVGVERETFSGLPAADVCSSCHAEPQGSGEEERRLVALLQRGDPLEWTPLFRQPPHVFYSHRTHVAVARIECRTCHGNIAETERPPERVRPLSMDDCVGCHRRAGASTACTGCHR